MGSTGASSCVFPAVFGRHPSSPSSSSSSASTSSSSAPNAKKASSSSSSSSPSSSRPSPSLHISPSAMPPLPTTLFSHCDSSTLDPLKTGGSTTMKTRDFNAVGRDANNTNSDYRSHRRFNDTEKSTRGNETSLLRRLGAESVHENHVVDTDADAEYHRRDPPRIGQHRLESSNPSSQSTKSSSSSSRAANREVDNALDLGGGGGHLT